MLTFSEAIIVPDVRASPLFSQGTNDWGLALVGLPLKIGSRVVGVMNIIYPDPREFAESDNLHGCSSFKTQTPEHKCLSTHRSEALLTEQSIRASSKWTPSMVQSMWAIC